MKRFFNDLKKYKNYTIYATKAELKNEVINSYLGSLWMILEPLCFMFVYMFIAGVVFKSKVEHFPVFIFIGLSAWNFFHKTVVMSVKLVAANKDTVTKVYLPKFVLLLVKMGVNGFKMFVSFLLVIIFMIFYRIPITWNILWFIPIIIGLIILTFGVSSIIMHFGVFAEDLVNIVNIFFRLMFYLTGVFYDLNTKVNNAYYRTLLLNFNPMANCISNLRNVLIYSSPPNYILVFVWMLIGILLCIIGVKTIYKYENTYVKVMK